MPHFGAADRPCCGKWACLGYGRDDVADLLHSAIVRCRRTADEPPPVLVAHDWGLSRPEPSIEGSAPTTDGRMQSVPWHSSPLGAVPGAHVCGTSPSLLLIPFAHWRPGSVWAFWLLAKFPAAASAIVTLDIGYVHAGVVGPVDGEAIRNLNFYGAA